VADVLALALRPKGETATDTDSPSAPELVAA
jgi:hypothetical protein